MGAILIFYDFSNIFDPFSTVNHTMGKYSIKSKHIPVKRKASEIFYIDTAIVLQWVRDNQIKLSKLEVHE